MRAARSGPGVAFPKPMRTRHPAAGGTAALLASRSLAAHPVDRALHGPVGEGEPRAEGPAAAPRALPRRAHQGTLAGRTGREHVMDAAQGTLAVGRTARPTGH